MTSQVAFDDMEQQPLKSQVAAGKQGILHIQVAQLSQRERAAGRVSVAKSGRLELGDNIYRQ